MERGILFFLCTWASLTELLSKEPTEARVVHQIENACLRPFLFPKG